MDAPLKRFLDSPVVSRVLRIRRRMNSQKTPPEAVSDEGDDRASFAILGPVERVRTMAELDWIGSVLDGSLEKQTTGDNGGPWERTDPFMDFPDQLSGGANL